ncbi:MAG: molybdopterin-guanine dinucleotide biosynthesis protein MobB [Candidatus Thiodiazotropha sp. (ex Lucinoma aequizonata)]|nr:molybdopterin-guanine dinucleotide biosynthesis protein MobB [Candidatus Thiodiazotropha sp. (ex Lucinoma aequizonata)]MCU7889577.1 molybdopterin-guanine dinucleotide biosynthesis protein MobB [Candidatus Thiodiazotropha sp. (ex Lucinoma aequizonata)]MCU7895775.1 molybdopterin-guanine dinucleotide biosynthesis protein MobB [Candidatus Thiodiazotropha sp. (ex Lucinoma aequizonata)]MCU7899783.1 molybdopterin-guanine dinucleotide biosynthesis protein MobB [Candidatus Thiodiazotropha sp. (ex Luci
MDLVLVEGFRHLSFPEIELHRSSLGKPLIFLEDSSIIAIASDTKIAPVTELHHLDLNNVSGIAAFIMGYCARF